MNIVSSCCSKPYEFLSSAEHKTRDFEECWETKLPVAIHLHCIFSILWKSMATSKDIVKNVGKQTVSGPY